LKETTVLIVLKTKAVKLETGA